MYYVYKYYVPFNTDFNNYYNIYVHPLNLHAWVSPFVYRQLSALLVNIVWKLGIYYNTQIAFVSKSYDQRIFFAAVFANWIALVSCATAVAASTKALIPTRGEAWPLLGGALCFFDFFVQPGVLAGLSEGVSWLLVAIGFLGWVRRSLLIIGAVLALSIVQRETIPIVFGAFSVFIMLLRPDSWRFHAKVLAVSVVAFLLYVGMRLIWAPAPGNDQQLNPTSFIHLLTQWGRLATREGLFQIFLSQNLLIGLGAVAILAVLTDSHGTRALRSAIDHPVIALYLTALVLLVVGVGTLSQSNNIGRVLSILTPIAAPLFAVALARLFPPVERAPQVDGDGA
jgi:hypothetical protein